MEGSSAWVAGRPESLGCVAVGHRVGLHHGGVGHSAAAREGEPKQPPPLELQVQLAELAALRVGEPEFLDRKQPWRSVPRCAGLARPGELMSWLG
jgi:hypothetical protein